MKPLRGRRIFRKAKPFRIFALCRQRRGGGVSPPPFLKGTKGCAFRISLNPLCAVHRGGPALGRPVCEANQVLPGDVLRRMRSILQELLRNSVGHDGINHSSALQLESKAIKRAFARTGGISRNMQKRSRWDLFWPRGGKQNAQIWVGG